MGWEEQGWSNMEKDGGWAGQVLDRVSLVSYRLLWHLFFNLTRLTSFFPLYILTYRSFIPPFSPVLLSTLHLFPSIFSPFSFNTTLFPLFNRFPFHISPFFLYSSTLSFYISPYSFIVYPFSFHNFPFFQYFTLSIIHPLSLTLFPFYLYNSLSIFLFSLHCLPGLVVSRSPVLPSQCNLFSSVLPSRSILLFNDT